VIGYAVRVMEIAFRHREEEYAAAVGNKHAQSVRT
jgi:hypothetical protein